MNSLETSPPPTTPVAPECITAVLRFTRFYSRRVAQMPHRNGRGTASRLSARVLEEIARRDAPTSTEIGRALLADAGTLSRLLAELERRGLVTRARGADGRRRHIALTDAGRAQLTTLQHQTHAGIARLLAPLSEHDRERLLDAMDTIERLLGGGAVEISASPSSARAAAPSREATGSPSRAALR